ncbi:hypothetical protein CL634_07315 [bacterium]|nr:hypothetical protein [bacterium]
MVRDMSNAVKVKFLRSQGPYTVGEVASFAPDVAERLIHDEAAIKFKDEKPALRKRPIDENKQALAARETDYVTK